jgi:acetoin utilization protein AcuB
MTRNVLVAPLELSLSAAWRVMRRERIRHLPVTHQGQLVGIVSDRDLLVNGRVNSKGELDFPPHVTVAKAMTPSPIVCQPSTPVSEVAQLMVDRKIDAVPVLQGGRLVGLVTSTDLLMLLLEREEARALPFRYRLESVADTAPI